MRKENTEYASDLGTEKFDSPGADLSSIRTVKAGRRFSNEGVLRRRHAQIGGALRPNRVYLLL